MSGDGSQTGTPGKSGLTIANLCCFAGVGMVLYAAFLLHSAVGFFSTGSALFAWGVLQHRMTTSRATKSR